MAASRDVGMRYEDAKRLPGTWAALETAADQISPPRVTDGLPFVSVDGCLGWRSLAQRGDAEGSWELHRTLALWQKKEEDVCRWTTQ